jgi:hypothetical protein
MLSDYASQKHLNLYLVFVAPLDRFLLLVVDTSYPDGAQSLIFVRYGTVAAILVVLFLSLFSLPYKDVLLIVWIA